MTREEAIKWFRESPFWHKDHVPFNMAIQALEQEPSGSEIPNNCEMRDATLEERESIDKYIKSISKPTGVKFGALEQEPSRDIEEIEEVINCDADAETKCKMISNILTSKPHYFKEPQACEDAISREDAIKQCGFGMTNLLIADCLRKLPSVKPQEKTGHWIIIDDCEKFIAKCSECGQIEDSRMIGKYQYCHCGANMSENPTSSKPEISSFYGLRSYVGERSDKE